MFVRGGVHPVHASTARRADESDQAVERRAHCLRSRAKGRQSIEGERNADFQTVILAFKDYAPANICRCSPQEKKINIQLSKNEAKLNSLSFFVPEEYFLKQFFSISPSVQHYKG